MLPCMQGSRFGQRHREKLIRTVGRSSTFGMLADSSTVSPLLPPSRVPLTRTDLGSGSKPCPGSLSVPAWRRAGAHSPRWLAAIGISGALGAGCTAPSAAVPRGEPVLLDL